MKYQLLNYLEKNNPTKEECDNLIETIQNYKNKIHPKIKLKFYDYIPSKESIYDDMIVNLLTENTCHFPHNKSYVNLHLQRCIIDIDECNKKDNGKYFIVSNEKKVYTWDNLKIFFDFDL